MSYHSAECYYQKCYYCLSEGCLCKCHKSFPLSKQISKKEQEPERKVLVDTVYTHHRGRPKRKSEERRE